MSALVAVTWAAAPPGLSVEAAYVLAKGTTAGPVPAADGSAPYTYVLMPSGPATSVVTVNAAFSGLSQTITVTVYSVVS